MNVISNPITPIAKAPSSHVRGHAIIWAQRLGAMVVGKDYDHMDANIIYFDLGPSFHGSWTIWNNITDVRMDRLINWVEAYESGKQTISIKVDLCKAKMPQNMYKRLHWTPRDERYTEAFVKRLEQLMWDSGTIQMEDLNLPSIIAGDSHCMAYSLPDMMIDMHLGKTLHREIARVLANDHTQKPGIIERAIATYDDVTLCMGSIDARFHAIPGKIDPKKLVEDYIAVINRARDTHDRYRNKKNISVCTPVPVEHEGRKMRKSAMLDGQTFIGSRDQRLEWTMDFIEALETQAKRNSIRVISPPKVWYLMDPEDYAAKYMEFRSSVHLGPQAYRSTLGWDEE